MNRSKLISLLVCIALMLSSVALLASCNQTVEENTTSPETEGTSEDATTEADTTVLGDRVEYSVTIKSEGNLPLANVEFEVYGDSDFTSLKGHGETNKKGVATVKLFEGATYYVKVISAPDGYKFEDSYTITDKETSITLKSYIRDNAPDSDFTYQLGDVVHNFVLSGEGANAVTVSDALEQYGCVVLNFWYIGCGPCKAEFPYMQSAYEKYSSKVGLFALNGNAAETSAMISEFQTQYGYTFSMSRADKSLVSYFNITAFPTTIVIDKYGVICFIEVGAITSEEPFVNVFEYFSSESYSETVLFSNIEYIPAK